MGRFPSCRGCVFQRLLFWRGSACADRPDRIGRAAAGLLAGLAAATYAAPLTLTEAERLALCAEPGVVALLEQAVVHDERAVAAGALPDPQIHFGAANLPIEGGGFRTEPMTQARVGVRQSFPPAGARTAATDRERTLAAARRAESEARRRSVLLGVRAAWLDAFLAARSAQLVRDARTPFAELATVTRSLYTVGDKDQQDVLRAELARNQLEVRLVGIEQDQVEAGAALRRWIGDAAERPVAAELPPWSPPPPLDALRAALAAHPELAAAAHTIAQEEAAVALARTRHRPQWTVDVAYGYRDGAMPDGASRSDVLSVTATLSAPMFQVNRHAAAVRAAERGRDAAQALRDESQRRLAATLLREHGRWVQLGRRLALQTDPVLSLAAANAEAALAAYRSDAADFADVMRSHIDDLEARLAHVRLRVARKRSHAELAYLGGFARLADAPSASLKAGCAAPVHGPADAP